MARLTLVRNVVLGVAVAFGIAQGCALQGEGERCEPNAARDSDCDDGLICVPGEQLLDNVMATSDDNVDFGRCCPPEGEAISDSRCTRAGGLPGGSGGSAGAGGDSAGGAPSGAGAGGEPPASAGAGGEPAAGGMSGGGGTPAAAGAAGAGGASGGAPASGGQGGAAGASAGAGGA